LARADAAGANAAVLIGGDHQIKISVSAFGAIMAVNAIEIASGGLENRNGNLENN
jgi:hypothetical protein